ncbi:MAG: GDSL-type esterase/lipase family protein [Faecousia sp.]
MRIFCFGDSNTYGYDPRGYLGDRYPTEDRWVDILAKKTQWDLLNAGANGRLIPRNPYALRLLSQHTPVDIFLVMLGTNDLLQGASTSEAVAQMETFLNQILTSCKNILLVAPPPMKRGAWVPTDELVAESIQLAEDYQALAQKLHIPFADTSGWHIELAFDGVHFTESGHHTFAANIASEIKKSFPNLPYNDFRAVEMRCEKQ